MLFLLVQRTRGERPEDWVPEEATSYKHVDNVDDEHSRIIQIDENFERGIVDIFSIHSGSRTGQSLKLLLADLSCTYLLYW